LYRPLKRVNSVAQLCGLARSMHRLGQNGLVLCSTSAASPRLCCWHFRFCVALLFGGLATDAHTLPIAQF
jgi:hypothetical protein